jgi:predicted dehydrogenase
VEKPLATTQEDCERIVDAERTNGGRTVVGFVLRSTPFYRTIYDAIASGKIGRLVSIQADELVGTVVSSVMNRGPWRRYTRTGGGAMLEKSCHDLDILNWMTASRPVSLDSHGRRNIFTPNPALPDSCDGCRVAEDCLYYKRPQRSESEDAGEEVLLQFVREDDRCIYNIDKDIVDTQSVIIEYENGVLATFMLTFNCPGPRASRNFHAVGTAGRVWGNLHDNEVFVYSNREDSVERFDTSGDGSGHGGGDTLHALELHTMMSEPTYRPKQDAAAGYLSAVMSFATDISRTENRRLFFRYGPSRIHLV